MRLALELKNVWNNVEIQKYKAFLAFFFFAEVKRSVKLQRQEKAAKIHFKKKIKIKQATFSSSITVQQQEPANIS